MRSVAQLVVVWALGGLAPADAAPAPTPGVEATAPAPSPTPDAPWGDASGPAETPPVVVPGLVEPPETAPAEGAAATVDVAPAQPAAGRAAPRFVSGLDAALAEADALAGRLPARNVVWARDYAAARGPAAELDSVLVDVAQAFPDDPPAIRRRTAWLSAALVVGGLEAAAGPVARSPGEVAREVARALLDVARRRSARVHRAGRGKRDVHLDRVEAHWSAMEAPASRLVVWLRASSDLADTLSRPVMVSGR